MKMNNKMRFFLRRMYMRLYSMFHPIKKQIVFSSFAGTQYSDSPRAISEKLYEMYPEYKIVWLYNQSFDLQSVPSYVECRTVHGKECLKTFATSFCVVNNENYGPGIYKRKKQYFVQTWHGDRALKKVLYDMALDGKMEIPVTDKQVTDLCVAGSDMGERMYRTAFQYTGEIIKSGMPRNDQLMMDDITKRSLIKNKLGINENTKVLLFAPTFRDDVKSKQDVEVDLKNIIELLEREGEQWICGMRAHSGTQGLNYEFSEKFIDMSRYPDMADLLQIADFLITDYSSSAGDFVLRKKPVVLAIYDVEEYQQGCRALYFPLESTGFILARTQEQLENIILTYKDEDYVESCNRVIEFYGINETGKASEEVCERINDFYIQNYRC